MTPRTSSPPPSSYEAYDHTTDDLRYRPQPSYSHELNDATANSVNNIALINNRNVRGNNNSDDDINTNNINDNSNDSGILNALFLRPFNIPRKVLSSTAMQFFSLVMIYSFCIMIFWSIFCASYLLTIYDDTRKMFRTSRVWARVKDGVRERIAMMGDDWEDFFQKYFDQWDGVDGNKNGHLGGGLNNNNGANINDDDGGDSRADWENWLKGKMFKFMTVVAGQDIADKFKQPTSTFQSQFDNKKNNTTNKKTNNNGNNR